MEDSNETRLSLHKALLAKGWFWENDIFYPPHKSFSVKGDDPPEHMLQRIYEKMKSIVEKIPESEHLYSDKEQIQNWSEDMNGLVETLEKLLDKK